MRSTEQEIIIMLEKKPTSLYYGYGQTLVG